MAQLASPETLRAIMDRQGYTLGSLAEKVGCHKSFISHLRGGRKRSCSPELAKRISEALDTTAIFLPAVSSSTEHLSSEMSAEAAA